MKINNEHIRSTAALTERGCCLQLRVTSPRGVPCPVRDQQSLSSSLFSPHCASFNVNAQSEDPALCQLHIPLCLCPRERPFYLIPLLLSASKASPVTGHPVPAPSALNLTSYSGVFLKEQGAQLQEPLCHPRASQGLSGQLALAVTPNSSWWVSKGPAHMRAPPQHPELISRLLPLLQLAPPELLAEARTLLPFNLN